MNNVVLVAVLDATDDLLEKATRFIFRKLFVHPNERGYSSLPNDIVEQLSSGNIFHYQKDVGGVSITSYLTYKTTIHSATDEQYVDD